MPDPVRPTQPAPETGQHAAPQATARPASQPQPRPTCGSSCNPAPQPAPQPASWPRPGPEPYSPNLLGPQPKGTVPLIFEPSAEDHASLFRLLSDPDFSLRDVAGFHNTSLPALSAWMARPDIAAELDNFEASLARKVRLSAVHSLPSAVQALTFIARAYTHAECEIPLAPNTEARVQRSRQAETTRRACWLLYRIARFCAAPPPSPRPPVQGGERPTSRPHGRRGDPPSHPSHPPLDQVAGVLSDLLAQALGAKPLDDSAPGGTALRAVSPTPPPSPDPALSPVSHARPSDLTPSRPSPSRPPTPPPPCSRTAQPATIPVPLTISANGRAHLNGTHASVADTS